MNATSIEEAMEAWVKWMTSAGRAPHTIQNNTLNLRNFLRDMGLLTKPISAIKEKHLDEWTNDTDKDLVKGSRMAALASIRGFFEFAIARGLIDNNPALNVRVRFSVTKPAKRLKTFSDSEVETLLKETDGFMHTAILLGRYAGLRLCDVAGLKWHQIKQSDRILLMEETSGEYKGRSAPAFVMSHLHKLPKNPSAYLFPDDQECAADADKRSKHSQQFLRLCNRVGLEGRNFNGLLATFRRAQSKSS